MLVYFAAILVVLLGFCGLAIDVGRVELRMLQLQAAADDAALTTAAEYQAGNNNWQQAAATEAATYNLPALTVDTPVKAPATGPYANDFSTFQVTLHQTVPTIFLGLLSHATSALPLTATASARLPPCAYFFASPAVNNGFSNQGVGAHLASMSLSPICPVWSRTGFLVDGFASINGAPAHTSGAPGQSQILGSTSPAISYQTPAQTDPLAWIPAPAFSHCDHTNVSYNGTATLSPGTWCGGLNASNATLTLQPGLYLITGGANWANSTLTGTGVTLYFTQGGGSGFGTFSLNNHSTMNLSAPTSAADGGIPGILLFADRAWTGGNQDFQFNTSTFRGDGILYTSATGIYDWQTGMSGPNYFSMVTANLYAYNAGIAFSGNYATLASGSPLHNNVSLVQ